MSPTQILAAWHKRQEEKNHLSRISDEASALGGAVLCDNGTRGRGASDRIVNVRRRAFSIKVFLLVYISIPSIEKFQTIERLYKVIRNVSLQILQDAGYPRNPSIEILEDVFRLADAYVIARPLTIQRPFFF